MVERDSDPHAHEAMLDPLGEDVQVFCFEPRSGRKSCGWKVGSVWTTSDGEVLISYRVFQDGKEWTDRVVFLDKADTEAPGLCRRHGWRVIDMALVQEKYAESLGTHRITRCGSTMRSARRQSSAVALRSRACYAPTALALRMGCRPASPGSWV